MFHAKSDKVALAVVTKNPKKHFVHFFWGGAVYLVTTPRKIPNAQPCSLDHAQQLRASWQSQLLELLLCFERKNILCISNLSIFVKMKKSSVIKKLASKNVRDIATSASVVVSSGIQSRRGSNINKSNEASFQSYEG